jgi:predicted DsbA family dithiol-disulfide isomerase
VRVSRAILTVLFIACLLAVFVYFGRTPIPKTKKPVAVVAGQSIYEDDLLPRVQAQLRNQEYELKSSALENLIDQRLLEAEAKKKGVALEQVLEQEVNAKVAEPTEAELKAAYQSQKDRPNPPFEEVKTQLQQALKRAKLQEGRQQFLNHLREQAGVSILLRPPKVEIGYDPARLRGNPLAPVIIIEFADFQCPFCRQAQSTLKALLSKYKGRVGLAYRDFPLRGIHAQGQLAAEASRCAGEQGKFWEYHDLLFANPDKLKREGLAEHAHTLKLDERQFNSCLSSGKYEPRIEEDLQEGIKAGVVGTPGFFINGSLLSGIQPEAAFDQMIQAELGVSKEKPADQ